MGDDHALTAPTTHVDSTVQNDPEVRFAAYFAKPGYQKYGRFLFAVLSAIPWIGSIMGASAALHAEAEQGRVNLLMHRWLEEHQSAFKRLEATVAKMVDRMEEIGSQVDDRIQDEHFLGLVRHGFRVWDEASTQEKRDFVRRTLTNAAGTKLCSDDVVRLFLQWIEQYDELHFRVIRVVFKSPGSTRADIWAELHGESVREDSAEADLFKLMMHDLSMGHVLRQHRETTSDGQFLSARPTARRRTRSPVMKSAFDDDKSYELTELGSQFVHYAMNEVVPRLGTVRGDTENPSEGPLD
jgi:hypothetical protein